jgi:hypothetical protein
MLKMILPGVIILRDAGKTTIKPNIVARKNIFLYTLKIFNLAIMNNEKINIVIISCASR